MENIEKLGELFSQIVENYNTFASSWKNLPLAREAFDLMRDSIPMRVSGELTPYTRIVLLDKMIGCLPERDCARLIMEIREYQLSLFPLMSPDDIKEDIDIDEYEGPQDEYVREMTKKDIKEAMKRTEDYLSPRISMEKWCKKYDVHLKFDPVERSQEWEDVIYDVELECAQILKDEPKHMGFCFSYWSTKTAVLARRGIDWSSPSVMNPRVMFD